MLRHPGLILRVYCLQPFFSLSPTFCFTRYIKEYNIRTANFRTEYMFMAQGRDVSFQTNLGTLQNEVFPLYIFLENINMQKSPITVVEPGKDLLMWNLGVDKEPVVDNALIAFIV